MGSCKIASHLLFTVIFLHYLSLLDIFEMKEEPVNHFIMETGAVNDRPIIGILTRPDKKKLFGDEFVDAVYVRFLQMAGARVVPVRPKMDQEYYQKIFNSINGLFLPGGSASMKNGTYRETSETMFNLAIEANDRGDYFPIWGTCLGFSMMIKIISTNFRLNYTHTRNKSLPLNFSPGFEDSRLFRHIPDKLIKHLSESNVTFDNHKWSVLVKKFQSSIFLPHFFRILTTTRDGNFEFVSTFEALSYPFYAVQWHPEKTVFNWSNNLTVDHSYLSIKVSHYLADFFVSEARKNSHRFDSVDEENEAVIENAQRIFVPGFKIGERFYFNYTNDL